MSSSDIIIVFLVLLAYLAVIIIDYRLIRRHIEKHEYFIQKILPYCDEDFKEDFNKKFK